MAGMRALGRGAVATVGIAALALSAPVSVSGQSASVLLVGPAGTPGAQYSSIQDAVNHAVAGDWVLVAPGVYHEKGYSPTSNPKGKPPPAEVYITVPNLHLRGMNRDTVIVDGTDFSTSQAAGTAPAGISRKAIWRMPSPNVRRKPSSSPRAASRASDGKSTVAIATENIPCGSM